MFARAAFSFHPPHPHTLSRFPSKSFLSPTYENFARNSFVSPTYAKTGVYPSQKCRRADIFFLLAHNPHSRPSCFSIICALSHFPYPTYLQLFLYLPHSCLKNRGCTPSGHVGLDVQNPPASEGGRYKFPSPPLLLYLLNLLPLHSPGIHKAVTGASPIVLAGLSQWKAVRGPTQTPCLPSKRGLRYTSTDAIRSARSAHEARTDY